MTNDLKLTANDLCKIVTGKTWDEIQPKTEGERFWADVHQRRSKSEQIYRSMPREKTPQAKQAEKLTVWIDEFYPIESL